MKSVFDEYLPVEARGGHHAGPRMTLTTDEFMAVRMAVRDTLRMPRRRGERGRELRRIADDYGVNVRTLYRWAEDETTTVVLNGWHAMFKVGRYGAPRQVTTWQRPR